MSAAVHAAMQLERKKKMKAETIINKIERSQVCSIHDAELLTSALHREKKLPAECAIRFRPLYGDFDIVNADYEEIGPVRAYSENMNIETLKNLMFSHTIRG